MLVQHSLALLTPTDNLPTHFTRATCFDLLNPCACICFSASTGEITLSFPVEAPKQVDAGESSAALTSGLGIEADQILWVGRNRVDMLVRQSSLHSYRLMSGFPPPCTLTE